MQEEEEEEEERRRGREEEEELNMDAVKKARALAELIKHPESTLSTSVFEDIRAEVKEELDMLKKALVEVEAEDVQRRERESTGEFNAGAYIRANNKLQIEKGKTAIPLLLSISEKVEVDMLGLSDTHLQVVLGVDEISGVQSTAEEVLRTIHTQKELIEREEELPKSLRTSSSLSSFLSGSTPAGVEADPHIVAAAAALSRTKACTCSRWRCEFGQVWDWLVKSYRNWEVLEGRVKVALAKNSAMSDFERLGELLKELRASSVVNKKLKAALAKRIHSIAGAATADLEEEQGRAMCRQCGRYPATFRFIPCDHVCMCRACVRHSLRSQEAFDMLLVKKAHVILPGGTPICCPECEQAAMVIYLSE